MMGLIRFIFLVLITVFLFETRISAQGCCTPGSSSLGGVERGIAAYRTLILSLNYQYNSLQKAYQGTRNIQDPLRRTAEVQTLNFEFEYGLQKKVSAVVIASYLNKTRELTVKSAVGNLTETRDFKASGFGDIFVLGKYQVVSPTLTSPVELSVGGGAKLPVGSYRQEQDGVRQSIDLQPGGGAADLLGWAFVMRSFPQVGLRLYGNIFYSYAGTNFDGYKFGDELFAALGAEYRLLEYLDFSLLARARFARKDFSNGRLLSATGGSFYYALPSLIYHEGQSSFRIFGQLPIYRNVNGIQLTPNYMLGLELQYLFDFRSNGESPETNKERTK